MATMTRLLRAEDLYELPSDFRCELVDGVLIEMVPPAPLHGRVQVKFSVLLWTHVSQNELGEVMSDVGFLLRKDPDTVRAPDVAFVRSQSVPSSAVPSQFWEIAPDLAVEIRSPNDSPGEIQAKVREWIEAGTRAVVLLNPATRSGEVIRSLTDRRQLSVGDDLDLSDIVPGFVCPVAEIFD